MIARTANLEPSDGHHVAALECLTAVETFLRTKLTEQIAADPPEPVDQQIADR